MFVALSLICCRYPIIFLYIFIYECIILVCHRHCPCLKSLNSTIFIIFMTADFWPTIDSTRARKYTLHTLALAYKHSDMEWLNYIETRHDATAARQTKTCLDCINSRPLKWRISDCFDIECVSYGSRTAYSITTHYRSIWLLALFFHDLRLCQCWHRNNLINEWYFVQL